MFTAALLISILSSLHIFMSSSVEIRPLPLAQFMEADEVFISTSGGGVIGLTKVDDRIFANAAVGPVTAKLYETYWDWMTRPAFRTEIGYR